MESNYTIFEWKLYIAQIWNCADARYYMPKTLRTALLAYGMYESVYHV